MTTALHEAPTGTTEPADGKLFEMPKIELDENSPTAITLNFTGSITLDRSQAADVALYNNLKHGKLFELTVAGIVTGAKKTYKRDNDGNIDAIPETKTLTIDSIDMPT